MFRVLKELVIGLKPLKKALLIFGSVAGGGISIFNSITSSFAPQREWNVEFSGGRLISVSGNGNNCAGDTCGEYFALNGHKKETLPESGSFATLGIKKHIKNIKSYGNNIPELRGTGSITILFCGNLKGNSSRGTINNNSWGSDVCQNNWVIPRDGRKNGDNNTRNGKGWYVIGFIWDANTQYFGFINEKNLIGKVLSSELIGKGIDVDTKELKNTGLFASTFTGLLDKKIGDIKCLHINNSNSRTLNGHCNGWEVWKDTISIPMGYVGKEQIKNKTIRDSSLVIMPVDQIRIKDGKLKIGNKYEWTTKEELISNFQLIK